MDIRDLVVTPLVIIMVYAVSYLFRRRLTDEVTFRYYFPALSLKIAGAIALGLLYQYYYDGGDTFNFHTHGSRVIWEAFTKSPETGWRLLWSSGEYIPGAAQYASRIPFYTDPSSFFVVRTAAILDLFTFSTYSATAVLFSWFSFFGCWLMYLTFYRTMPQAHGWLALAILFIPSVIFWGSGILKDTLTLGALGLLTHAAYTVLIEKKVRLGKIVLLLFSAWIIYSVKIYILLCYLPALLLWMYASRLAMIRSAVLKIMLVPVISAGLLVSGYYAVVLIGKDDPRYSLDRIAITAQITAYDIGFYTGKDAGSTYTLGELDGTFGNLISKFPQAVNVSLFRPYLWEVRNPLMLLSALESFALFILTLGMIFKCGINFFRALKNPTVLFCLVFSITFAFAVGVSTFNFGTLARYKIPLIPFYLLALIHIYHYANKERNKAVLDSTE
ncbi:MAG: hypothetical protein RMK43_06720 [Cyclobacteriaceae bacterium]|nr:hypothetical protein [Cyclobacteriaceae bacterium]